MACWISAIVMVIAIICAIIIVGIMGAGLIWIWVNLVGNFTEKRPFLGGAIITILVASILFWLWVELYVDCIIGG